VRYNTDSYKTESELIFTFCGDLCQITSKWSHTPILSFILHPACPYVIWNCSFI
jgi:hypothetical protein